MLSDFTSNEKQWKRILSVVKTLLRTKIQVFGKLIKIE